MVDMVCGIALTTLYIVARGRITDAAKRRLTVFLAYVVLAVF